MKENIKWLILGVCIIIAAWVHASTNRYHFILNSETGTVFICDQQTGEVTQK